MNQAHNGLNFVQYLAITMKLTPTDVTHLLAVRDLLRSRDNDEAFWFGIQAWGAHRGRVKLKNATRGTEPERWIAFGRHEESCDLMQSLRELCKEIERVERAFVETPGGQAEPTE